MRLMTRMGKVALDHLGSSDDFTRCLHAKADLDMERRFICHYPQDNTIWSVGSGYGGNALLGKKCLALRIASKLGQKEGWLAEHMLIVGVENPERRDHTISAALSRAPAARPIWQCWCRRQSMKGWKIHTIGDDIAWLRVGRRRPTLGDQSRGGCFRRGARYRSNTNPNAMRTVKRDTIFTNVALTSGWNCMVGRARRSSACQCVKIGAASLGIPRSGTPAAHPNSPLHRVNQAVPELLSEWENPEGVPISAILFGARRQKLVPLVYQVIQLAARHIFGRHVGIRNHCGGHRRGGRRAARSDGHAAILRLQHGGLLGDIG